MIQLLLVDDREEITNYIAKVGNWDAIGVEVVGRCSDSLKALAIIREKRPEIILTDIHMPQIDGLELARYAKLESPSTKVILLSGYDDFSYAQKAVSLGTFEYILKPAKIEEIEAVVQKAVKTLEEERRLYLEQEDIKQKLRESYPVLQEKYILSLVSNPYADIALLESRLDYFKIKLDKEYNCIAVFMLDDSEMGQGFVQNDYDLILFGIMNIIQETFEEVTDWNCYVLRGLDDTVIVLINADEGVELSDVAQLSIKRISDYLFKSVSSGLGRWHKGLADIHKSYVEAKNAAAGRFLMGKGSTVSYDDLCFDGENKFIYPTDCERRMLEYIRLGLRERALDEFDLFTLELQKNGPHYAGIVKDYMPSILITIYKYLAENGIDTGKLSIIGSLNRSKLEQLTVFEDMCFAFKEIIAQAAEHIAEIRSLKETRIVDEVKGIINQRFMEPDLSLNDLAKSVFISPSYLSGMIKKALGETFIDYVTRLRIEYAKILLLSGENKVYEAAEKVGYLDRRYFSEQFKKYTGLTPKEFAAGAKGAVRN